MLVEASTRLGQETALHVHGLLSTDPALHSDSIAQTYPDAVYRLLASEASKPSHFLDVVCVRRTAP